MSFAPGGMDVDTKAVHSYYINVSSSDSKAKDILSSLSQRRCLGDRLLSRVGRRAFERPNLAISGRLYKLLDVPDPYDPEPEARRWQAKLGPVSLRLGENRRQPAPHLRPKPAVPSNPSRPAFNPRGVPEAKRTAPSPQPHPSPQARQPNTQAPKESSEIAAEFGSKRGATIPLAGNLPIRPDMAEQIRKAQAEGKPTPKATQGAEPTTETPNRRHSFARPYRGVQRSGPMAGMQARRTQSRSAPSSSEMSATSADSPPPRLGLPQKQDSGRARAFRMRRTRQSNAPTVRNIEPPAAESVPSEEAALPTPEPPSRHIPKDNSSMGLDDLFGFGAPDESRMRLPKRKQKPNN